MVRRWLLVALYLGACGRTGLELGEGELLQAEPPCGVEGAFRVLAVPGLELAKVRGVVDEHLIVELRDRIEDNEPSIVAVDMCGGEPRELFVGGTTTKDLVVDDGMLVVAGDPKVTYHVDLDGNVTQFADRSLAGPLRTPQRRDYGLVALVGGDVWLYRGGELTVLWEDVEDVDATDHEVLVRQAGNIIGIDPRTGAGVLLQGNVAHFDADPRGRGWMYVPEDSDGVWWHDVATGTEIELPAGTLGLPIIVRGNFVVVHEDLGVNVYLDLETHETFLLEDPFGHDVGGRVVYNAGSNPNWRLYDPTTGDDVPLLRHASFVGSYDDTAVFSLRDRLVHVPVDGSPAHTVFLERPSFSPDWLDDHAIFGSVDDTQYAVFDPHTGSITAGPYGGPTHPERDRKLEADLWRLPLPSTVLPGTVLFQLDTAEEPGLYRLDL